MGSVVGRIGLNSLHPVIAHGELPSRAVVGEPVGIEATVFREGHDAVAASVVWRSPSGADTGFHRMRPLGGGTDRWRAEVVPDSTGTWSYVVEAWGDPLATWYHNVEVKVDAGQSAEELANDLEIGARLFDRIADALSASGSPEAALVSAAAGSSAAVSGSAGSAVSRAATKSEVAARSDAATRPEAVKDADGKPSTPVGRGLNSARGVTADIITGGAGPEAAELARAVAEDLRRAEVDVPLRITRAMSREARALASDHPVRELITRSPRY
ncbi:MAG TPA: maltotransferase domain-containing protein, partial [Jatrophihabitans sp.]